MDRQRTVADSRNNLHIPGSNTRRLDSRLIKLPCDLPCIRFVACPVPPQTIDLPVSNDRQSVPTPPVSSRARLCTAKSRSARNAAWSLHPRSPHRPLTSHVTRRSTRNLPAQSCLLSKSLPSPSPALLHPLRMSVELRLFLPRQARPILVDLNMSFQSQTACRHLSLVLLSSSRLPRPQLRNHSRQSRNPSRYLSNLLDTIKYERNLKRLDLPEVTRGTKLSKRTWERKGRKELRKRPLELSKCPRDSVRISETCSTINLTGVPCFRHLVAKAGSDWSTLVPLSLVDNV